MCSTIKQAIAQVKRKESERTELEFPHVVAQVLLSRVADRFIKVCLLYSPQMRRTSVHELSKSDCHSLGILQEIQGPFSCWLRMVYEWKTVQLIHQASYSYVEQVG